MTLCDRVLEWLPYSEPFLFVDGFDHIDENGASGHYTFRHDQSFYQGHFPGNPVTPGVILIETMAQIGLVGLGMYLELLRRTGRSEPKKSESLPSTDNSVDGSGGVDYSESVRELPSLSQAPGLAFTESEVAFLHPVLPGQTVFVRSEKIYFRLGKLKCRVEMFLREGSKNTVRVCKGRMSGMILPPPPTNDFPSKEGSTSTEQGTSTEEGLSTEQDRSTES